MPGSNNGPGLIAHSVSLEQALDYELARSALPAQTVDATLAWSLLAGVSKPKVFLGRWFKRSETWSSCA